MCGIAGIVALTKQGEESLSRMEAALPTLFRRGPNAHGIFRDLRVALGHTRLSIIDTTEGGSQPMTDPTGRYTIIFNGEFFNFNEHRKELIQRGISLKSSSDTEVLLHWYILEGEKCLERVNGFFAFSVYDKEEKSLFIARDRLGVKPLVIYQDKDRFLFASELKTLMAMDIPRAIDPVSLFTYLQLNYIPGPSSILRNVRKLMPGHFIRISDIGGDHPVFNESEYYRLASHKQSSPVDYVHAQNHLQELLDASVQRRLVSDVPLGAFLSGGIDSSVICGLAARHTGKLKTFSIGFKDEPLFDETKFAEAVAKFHKTDHTVFRLTNDDLFGILFDALDYIDEPFADSSALNVFLLSRETKKHVTVALSGDGADELFSGYNKHAAEWRMRNKGVKELLAANGRYLWSVLPKSRNSKAGNWIRQLDRFAKGARLDPAERYWRWAGFEDEETVRGMVRSSVLSNTSWQEEYRNRKHFYTRHITGGGDMNDVLQTDTELVLVNDMLTKVDMMSMANSLEVRTPFLDYTVVDFAFSLPSTFKIDRHDRKKIVRDAFRDLLPDEIYHRRKQGFEVPLLKWFRSELRPLITDDLLSDTFVAEQGIFHPEAIKRLKKKLFSNSPGEAVAQVWALIVFQYWWKRNIAAG